MKNGKRSFNVAGPCRPDRHYMLPPLERLPRLRELVTEGEYFVVHAPRQSGKTTLLLTLVEDLRATTSFAVALTTCEVAATAGDDIERGVDAVIHAVAHGARDLPDDLRPPDPESVASVPAEHRLVDFLTAWSEESPQPVVLLLDEIDALRDGILLSVLHQLRAGFPYRPDSFPHALALVGLRDVRDYRIRIRDESESLGTSSPFNVKVESLVLPDFTAGEVATLYDQHGRDTGQTFTDDAKARAWELTRGQPWLVNALGREVVLQVPDRSRPITVSEIDRAGEALILRRDTHLDSLVERLRQERVRRVIEPILAGRFLSRNVMDDDIEFVIDLGLVRSSSEGLVIANPIYREVIPRVLSESLQQQINVPEASFVDPQGRLDFTQLLEGFASFWRENAEFFLVQAPYSEAAAQLIFMAYLQRVVNGGGFVDREYAVGSGRVDLCVRWPLPDGAVDRHAMELKVRRDRQGDVREKGLEQLTSYLERLGLDRGTLLIFDQRDDAPPLPERMDRETVERSGRTIDVFHL